MSQSLRSHTVEISPQLLEAIESIPDTKDPAPFTAEMDAVILRYYEVKRKKELAQLLGVGRHRLRRRWEELKR